MWKLWKKGRTELWASNFVRSLKVSLMDPSICSVFNSFDNRHCLVIGTRVFSVRMLVKDRRPQDGSSFSRLNSKIHDGKVRTATFLNIVQVKEKGQYPDTTWSLQLVWNEVATTIEEGETRGDDITKKTLVVRTCAFDRTEFSRSAVVASIPNSLRGYQ